MTFFFFSYSEVTHAPKNFSLLYPKLLEEKRIPYIIIGDSSPHHSNFD